MKLNIDELPQLLTLGETAGVLRLSPLTIKRWAISGKLKGVRINERGDWRFLNEEVRKVMGI